MSMSFESCLCWAKSSLGNVDSSSSIHVHADSFQKWYRLLSTFPMSKHVESNHCRLTSISVMVNVDSLRCQLWPITAHVDVDNCYCRHSVHRVVQRIQLILATSSTLRLGRWIWITRRPSPSHWPRGNYKLGPTYTTILLFWCIFNIHCNIDHITLAAGHGVVSFKLSLSNYRSLQQP